MVYGEVPTNVMKWSLRSKILSGYGLVLLLLVFILAVSLVNLQRLGRASASILKENYRSIIAAEYMIDSIERQDSALLLLLLGYTEEGGRQFTENIALFMQWLARAKDNITIDGETELVQAIEEGYLGYLSHYETLAVTVSREDRQGSEGSQYYHDTILPLFREIRKACHDLRELNQHTMYNSSEQAQRVAARATVSLVVTGVSVLVLGLLFSFFVSRLIVRPLGQVMEGIRAIEKGDYEVQISTASSDELGRLSADFNAMVKQLKRYRELNIGEIMAEKRKIETIIHNIDAGIVMLDTEARVTDINAKASEILGVKASEVEGRHFLEVLPSEEILQELRKSLDRGSRFPGPGEENSLTLEEHDEKRHYQFFVTPISDKPGKIQGAVLLLRDVTQLEELNQLKSEFIMKVSHELKNPLTGLAMNISLLKEADLAGLSDGDRELIARAEEDLQRLRVMVSDLLDLSRIESGKLNMEMTATSLGMVIDQAVETMRGQAEQSSIKLAAKYANNLPQVRADANKILWVVTNLIANALRYTPKEGEITVSAGESGSSVQVDVHDTGQGIPYEKQSRIFDKFFQVKHKADQQGSLGIGLAICKEIIKAHEGIIWVESAPGAGSTFSFTLPTENAT